MKLKLSSNSVVVSPASTKEVLVLAGCVSQWRSWVSIFARDNLITRRCLSQLKIESNGVLYRGAVCFIATQGHCCSEVIKFGTYWKVFSPEELRMIDFCACVAREREAAKGEILV